MKVSARDILLRRGGNVSQRPANKLYHEILKSNVALYKCLAKTRRTEFAGNIFKFITTQLGRKFIEYNNNNFSDEEASYDHIEDILVGAKKIGAAIRDDKVLQAANRSNPVWLLGEHDPTQAHANQPFVHYSKASDTWTRVNQGRVQEILQSDEGFANLLVLPAEVSFGKPPAASSNTESIEVADMLLTTKKKAKRADGAQEAAVSALLDQLTSELQFESVDHLKQALSTVRQAQQQLFGAGGRLGYQQQYEAGAVPSNIVCDTSSLCQSHGKDPSMTMVSVAVSTTSEDEESHTEDAAKTMPRTRRQSRRLRRRSCPAATTTTRGSSAAQKPRKRQKRNHSQAVVEDPTNCTVSTSAIAAYVADLDAEPLALESTADFCFPASTRDYVLDMFVGEEDTTFAAAADAGINQASQVHHSAYATV